MMEFALGQRASMCEPRSPASQFRGCSIVPRSFSGGAPTDLGLRLVGPKQTKAILAFLSLVHQADQGQRCARLSVSVPSRSTSPPK